MHEYQLYMNGGFEQALSGKVDDSINPMNGEVYARVQQACVEDVNKALDYAWDAFQAWRTERPSVREAVFLKAADILEARKQELVDVLVDEAGSTLLKAMYETSHTPSHMRSIAGEYRRG